jgi:hypothetical protein
MEQGLIEEHIERMISEYENTAEEYFQEVRDEEQGNMFLAKAEALTDLLKWIRRD